MVDLGVARSRWWFLFYFIFFLQGHNVVRSAGHGRGRCGMANVGCGKGGKGGFLYGFLGFVNLWVFVKGKLFQVLILV